MKLAKLGNAGLKLLGTVSCGLGSAGALYMASISTVPEATAILSAVGVGMGGTSVALAAGATADLVMAFRSSDDDE